MSHTLPALRQQRGFEAISSGDEGVQTGLQVQQHELAIEFEAEGVPERRFDREAAEIVGGAP